MNTPPTPPKAPIDAKSFAAGVLRAEAEAVLNAVQHLDEAFDRAVTRIVERAEAGGTVICGGLGKSGLIAQKISATLASTGTPSHFLHPTEAMHGDLGRVRAGDVLLLLSYSGTGDEVLALAAIARQDGVPVLAITGRLDNHLARLADAALGIGDVTEACPHNLAPTASTTAMLALGDALALAVSRARGFSAEDFAKRHPGGDLGRQMTPLLDVLRFRANDNLPLLRDNQPIGDALSQAAGPGRRAGAVLLVDEAGRLTGIFTDGDLRRLLITEGPAALQRPAHEVMTRQPKHLRDDALVRDAVQSVRELRVDELPVVDADGKPVGLVDVQDLIALKVIENTS